MLFEDTRSTQAPLLDGNGARNGKSGVRRAMPFIVGFFVLVVSCAVVLVLVQRNPDEGLPSMQSSSHQPRLRIINGCESDSLWVANFAFQSPYFPQDVELKAGQARDFMIPQEGLAATRFWPKWGCDRQGSNCKIGQSGGPGESCGPIGCAPPVDSKFEATFGCMPDSPSCAVNPSLPSEKLGPEDWWDVSQVRRSPQLGLRRRDVPVAGREAFSSSDGLLVGVRTHSRSLSRISCYVFTHAYEAMTSGRTHRSDLRPTRPRCHTG